MVAVVFFLFNALNYCKIFKIWGTRVSYYHYHYHYYYVLLTINKLRLLYGSGLDKDWELPNLRI